MQKEFKLSYVFTYRMTSQSCVFVLRLHLVLGHMYIYIYLQLPPSRSCRGISKWARPKAVCFTLLWASKATVAVRRSLGFISSKSLLSPTFTGLFCCLESFNSSGEFCPLCKLERRGQMMPGFAKWFFTWLRQLVPSLPWQRGAARCSWTRVMWLVDLLLLTRLLVSAAKFVRET